jgi:hypothetical protein
MVHIFSVAHDVNRDLKLFFKTCLMPGELLSVQLPDGRIIEHLHDPLGRRIAKKLNGVIVEKYLW